MKRFISLYLVAILAPAVTCAQVVVNDSWADSGRNNGADLLDADWWSSNSSSGNSIEVGAGFLGMVTGTSGRGIHGTFTPQTLGIGDTLRATYTFTTPATVGSALASPFRAALMDFNNSGLAADLESSSTFAQPLYIGLPGYMADFDVNTGATADTTMREHNQSSTSGRLLGTTAEWTQFSPTGPDTGYTFAPNTTYQGVLSVTRTGTDSMDIFSSLSQGATLLTAHTVSDTSGIANNFGLLGFWANSSTFGSSATQNAADNGLDFSNITIEFVPVPEPSSVALFFGGIVILSHVIRRRIKS